MGVSLVSLHTIGSRMDQWPHRRPSRGRPAADAALNIVAAAGRQPAPAAEAATS